MMTIEVAPEKANNPALMFQDSIQEQQRYQDLIRTLLSLAEYSPYSSNPEIGIDHTAFTAVLMAYEPEWTKARLKELIGEDEKKEEAKE